MTFDGERLKSPPPPRSHPKIRNKTMSTLVYLFNILLGVIAFMGQEKAIKDMQIVKHKVKLLLFQDDKILHVENSKDFNTKMSLDIIREFSQVAGQIKKTEINFYALATNHLRTNYRNNHFYNSTQNKCNKRRHKPCILKTRIHHCGREVCVSLKTECERTGEGLACHHWL